MSTTIVKTSNNTPIYQVLSKGERANKIQYGDKEAVATLPLTSQDEIITKDFYDQSGEYIQLRVIQVIPRDEDGVYDNNRDNKLYLFAQNKLQNENEEYSIEDDFGYIGNLTVDDNFKLSTVQQLIDTENFNLESYTKDFNNTFQFVYDDFDGSQNHRTVIFGDNQYNIIKTINDINYLCLYDVKVNKANQDESIMDTWSILYMPYLNGNNIEVFMFAMLKDTTTPIDNYARPQIRLEYIDSNPELELYDMEQEPTNYFFSAKSGIAASATNINVNTIDDGTIVLNSGLDLIREEDETETNYNPYTWPLINKEFDNILSLRNCYYSFNKIEWYPVFVTKQDENNQTFIERFWIDLSNNPSEPLSLVDTIEHMDFKITDKNLSSLNENGNLILQAYNTLSIVITNNYLKIRSGIYNNETVTIKKIEETKDGEILRFIYNNEEYYSYLLPLSYSRVPNAYDLDVYNLKKELQDKSLRVIFANNPPIYIRVYKNNLLDKEES